MQHGHDGGWRDSGECFGDDARRFAVATGAVLHKLSVFGHRSVASPEDGGQGSGEFLDSITECFSMHSPEVSTEDVEMNLVSVPEDVPAMNVVDAAVHPQERTVYVVE